MSARILVACVVAAVPVFVAPATAGQSALSGEPITVTRASGPIVIDGDLSDPGWHGAARVERWYEINPGDNIAPPVRSVGYLTYDETLIRRRGASCCGAITRATFVTRSRR